MSGPDRRPLRIAALRDALRASALDGMLVSHLPNIRWLTGFSGTSALLLVTGDDLLLLTDFRYATQVREEAGDAARCVIESTSLWTRLWSELGALAGLETLAFESAHLPHAEFERFVGPGARWHWRPAVNLVEVLRERKDAGELAAIRDAVAMAESALGEVLAAIRPGMTELAVAGRLEQALREAGSEAHPFEAIVASGPRSALPHARASTRVLERGDLVLLDFGAVARGYCADLTRTVVLGPATARQREVHGIVREANLTASAGVRAGMRGRDADRLARDYIESFGFGEEFGHSLGHGIGLEVHESPRLARSAESPLPADAVVTIEPGIYLPGWGGVRIEDDVHLAEHGPVVLSGFRRDLIEV